MISANISCEPPSQIVPQICKCIIIAGTKNFQEQYYHFNGEFNYFACVHFCAANIKLCPVNIESSFICISIYHEVDKKSHLEPFQLPLHLQCCTCHFTWRYQLPPKCRMLLRILSLLPSQFDLKVELYMRLKTSARRWKTAIWNIVCLFSSSQ